MTTTTKQLLIVAAVAATSLLSAGSVLAQDWTPDQGKALVTRSTANRNEVKADAALAVAARGQFDLTSLLPAPRGAVTLSRAAVKAETVRAIKAHEISGAGEFYSVLPSRSERTAAR